MSLRDDFCVFILTHGRPDNIRTLKALKKGNYNGKIYIVIDNEDEMELEYKERYGEQVIVFDKLAVAQRFDAADNFTDRRTIVYARNACFEIAKELGIKYFLELDDDYTDFLFRKDNGKKLMAVNPKQLDESFEAMLKFLDKSGALTVALAQGGDFIGGRESANFKKGILRKAMNTFFCTTERPFNFLGRVNEDVNTYANLGSKGELFFTITDMSINQATTQTSKGGMTDVYLDSGTYTKSFYTVMFNPSSVKVGSMGGSHKRLHHKINWNATVPKIISSKYKKGMNENG